MHCSHSLLLSGRQSPCESIAWQWGQTMEWGSRVSSAIRALPIGLREYDFLQGPKRRTVLVEIRQQFAYQLCSSRLDAGSSIVARNWRDENFGGGLSCRIDQTPESFILSESLRRGASRGLSFASSNSIKLIDELLELGGFLLDDDLFTELLPTFFLSLHWTEASFWWVITPGIGLVDVSRVIGIMRMHTSKAVRRRTTQESKQVLPLIKSVVECKHFAQLLRHTLRSGGWMRHSVQRNILWFVTLTSLALNLSTSTAAESVFQKMKRAALEQACRGGDQKSCQDLAKMGQKQSPQGQPAEQSSGPQQSRPQPPGKKATIWIRGGLSRHRCWPHVPAAECTATLEDKVWRP